MRIMILDDKRADDLEATILSATTARVHKYSGPADFGESEPIDFDFIILHFNIGEAGYGENAFDFLDGLFKRQADESPHGPKREYFNLGFRIGRAGKNPSVLAYTGGYVNNKQLKRLHAYGPTVCMRLGAAAINTEISKDLKDDLMRALQGGRVDLEMLCPESRSYSMISAILILCQGYLAAHVNPMTGEPEIEEGKGTRTYAEFAKALETMTEQKFPHAAQALSAMLPSELQTPERKARLREQALEASWWRVVATNQLTELVKAELGLRDAPDSELGELIPLINLIEEKKPVLDIALVARAYNMADSLLGRVTIQL